MRYAFLAASAALITAIAPAAVAAPVCTVLSDAAADVVLTGGTVVPDTHVDVRAVTVQTGTRGLTFRIKNTALTEGRLGEWRLTFTARRSRLFVGAGRGMWINADDYRGTFGFVAGVEGRKANQVTGSFDYVASEIRIDVPYSAFSGAAPRRGDTVTAISLDARESFVHGTPVPVSVVDTATARAARLSGC